MKRKPKIFGLCAAEGCGRGNRKENLAGGTKIELTKKGAYLGAGKGPRKTRKRGENFQKDSSMVAKETYCYINAINYN